MNEMIERVARAMWEARQQIHGRYPDCGALDQQCEMVRDWVTQEARAAIKAMRDPTPEMTMANGRYNAMSDVQWLNMIDAALGDGPAYLKGAKVMVPEELVVIDKG